MVKYILTSNEIIAGNGRVLTAYNFNKKKLLRIYCILYKFGRKNIFQVCWNTKLGHSKKINYELKYGIRKLEKIKEDTGKILGKLPIAIKIQLQGNGIAAISKKINILVISVGLHDPKFMLERSSKRKIWRINYVNKDNKIQLRRNV